MNVKMGRTITEDTYVHDNTGLIFTCDNGYEKYAGGYETDGRLICRNGALFAGTPECRPRRCLINTEADLEYFIDGNRILDRYIHDGTLMQARCPDLMELVRSFEYLDREEEYVKCNMGTLEPDALDCTDKRCYVTEIENGHFRNSGFVIVAGKKIQSGTNISLICSDGYELYNERNSMYFELEQTEIKCYNGSFTTEIPSCKPKRCKADKSRNLLPEFSYVEHGTNLTFRCPYKMEFLREKDIEETSVLCSKGIWTPELPMCIEKFCNEPAFQYIIVKNGTLVNKDNIFSHGTKLNASCDSSSKLHGDKIRRGNDTSTITECSHGKWKPKFSCKKTCTLPRGTFKHFNREHHNVTLKEGDRIPDGRKMVPVCSSGHMGVKHSTCSNGTWIPSLKGCAEDIGRCSIPTVTGMQFTYIRNSIVVADKHLEEGEIVAVSCSFGYEIDTLSERGYEYDNYDSQSTTYSVEVHNTTESDELRPISDGIHICRKTGKLEPDIRFACKPIICHRLDDYGFENGIITYSSPIHYLGTVASFICNPGYTRDGQANRTCQEDGTWSGTCVTCQRYKTSTMCPVPCVPDWAIKRGSHTYDLGSRVEFQCLSTKMQYSGDSSNIRHCVNGSKSASWNGTLINCKGLNDVSLRMIADGVADEWINLSRALDIQSKQVILADDEPSRNALKILQYWRDIVMRDKPRSLIPDLIIVVELLHKSDVAVALRSLNGLDNIRCKQPSLNGKVKPNQTDYLFGQSVRVTSCDDGYMLVNQSYLVCTENGTWSGNSTCRHVECEPLADDYKVIQPGVVPGRFSHQTVVEIICNKSLAPYDDVKVATCYKSIWQPQKPFCQIPCLLQGFSGTHYNYSISRDKVYPGPVSSGRRVKVTCEKGFIPVPQVSSVSMCMNGVWNPDISRCEKEDCEIGKIYWHLTRYKRVRDNPNMTISYKGYSTDLQCYASCANDHRCTALYIYKTHKDSYHCKHFTENTRKNPQAFVAIGVEGEHIYDKTCNERARRDGSV
ncbi:hypothetical protein CHS0354_037634 [Potamilus streckersoni]|uniref:Sushi domain-containing protein n=1 Tax=Potamilus streckersoni TaxID=2493646 RepID=A0AAE0W7R5_9BIVA|nr:hypothetical protein CHS0354_037634 [Potamilus streckersoni]